MKKILALVSVMALSACGNGIHYGDGYQVGELQRLSKQGLLCKTWEGELVRYGIRSTASSQVSNLWDFSMHDDAVAAKMTALTQGDCKLLKVTYQHRAMTGLCFGDTEFLVTDVSCEQK